MAQNLVIWALMYLGELGELSRRLPALLADARSSGNLYLATELCTRSNYCWLAADDPDEGERDTIESIARWSHKGFHRQHYSAMLARVQTALYRGDADAAWRPARRTGTRYFAVRSSRASRSCESSRSICGRAARWRWPRGTGPSPPIPVGGPRRAPGASPASACRGPIRSPCCSAPASRISRAGLRWPCDTSTMPSIDSIVPT